MSYKTLLGLKKYNAEIQINKITFRGGTCDKEFFVLRIERPVKNLF